MGLLEPGNEDLLKTVERVENTENSKEDYRRLYIADIGIIRYPKSLEKDEVNEIYRQNIGNNNLHYMRGRDTAASD